MAHNNPRWFYIKYKDGSCEQYGGCGCILFIAVAFIGFMLGLSI
jgi:hypothetical protein